MLCSTAKNCAIAEDIFPSQAVPLRFPLPVLIFGCLLVNLGFFVQPVPIGPLTLLPVLCCLPEILPALHGPLENYNRNNSE